MKGVYLITIAFLAPWAINAASSDQDLYVDIPIQCPYPSERFPENTTTNLPHENDCTKYYKCHVGFGVLQNCSLMIDGDPVTRLHYNRRLQVCDWPWQAGCDSCPPKDRNGVYPPPSKINHETDTCGLYYECINGMKYLRNCPAGTCFSRTCQDCVVYRDGGYCNGFPPPPTSPSTSSPSTSSCVDGDTRPHECDCAKYYICLTNDDYVTECTGGLHYSRTTKTCLPPDEAGCL